MVTSQEEARQSIQELVERFRQQTQRGPRLNERQTAASYIEPLFEALGWAVRNPEEVSLEVTIAGDRADYTFRLNGVTRFIVEAKAPHRDLNDPAFKKQAITYAYNKGVNWAILTNFARLMVFHAESERQFLNLSLDDYLSSFDKLWLLSKEAFASGAFQKEAQAYGAMLPQIPVEKSLFEQLRQWREELFSQILQYKYKDTSRLPLAERIRADELIQHLLNRLIFIRNAEDRGLEENRLRAELHQWRSSGHKGHLIERLRSIFHDFAQSYDSDLFPKSNDPWDETFVDDKLLGQIVEGLYDRPGKMAGYDFKAIGADVLGSIYEQYLGHVAQVVKERSRLNQAQTTLPGMERPTIRLEEMPQRRKAQGIYYTPRWVVDYIVRQTVGRFLAEHTHDEILHMKILDPACGSGSFLIRAYDELLRYHARVRSKGPGELPQEDRLPILTGNIYGVDLDDQAVQIARLNLLLRALARRETLPSLAENIRRGNSLISGGAAELKPYFKDAWRDKHPFNWGQGFPEIMRRGGFDVVIGNPPYLGFQGIGEDKRFYRDHYGCAIGRFDLYMPFIEKGLSLLKEGGLLGFICPTNFMKRQHGWALRKFLQDEVQIDTIVDFEHGQVFEGAINYTCILVLRKTKPEGHAIAYYPGGIDKGGYEVRQSALSRSGWVFVPPDHQGLIKRIEAAPATPLGDLTEGIYEGVVTGENSVFLLLRNEAHKLGLEQSLIHPAIQGKHIERYFLEPLTHVLIYPYKDVDDKSVVISEDELREAYPKVYQYLYRRKSDLGGRGYFERSNKAWYELWNERGFGRQAVRKIVVQEIAAGAKFASSTAQQFYMDTVCSIILKDRSIGYERFVVGLLNSKLLEYYYKRITVPKMGGFYIYKTMFLKRLPIRRIDFANPEDKALHDRLVALVERMLEFHRRKADSSLPQSEREDMERDIARTDGEIDDLVYDLYGFTREERRLVEESFN
ncbi:MAG: N-6 DNA methylase [Chloroflexi bacterium]|nr:N-6 DNA methylase [Chloroflexota bacterium]